MEGGFNHLKLLKTMRVRLLHTTGCLREHMAAVPARQGEEDTVSCRVVWWMEP